MQENEVKAKKIGKSKWTILFLVGVLAGGSIYFFTKGGNKILQPTYTPPVVNKETITQEEFENLPVGVIYEFSEEEQKQFLEEAKKKYETYKDAMPEAHSEVCVAEKENEFDCYYDVNEPIQYSENKSFHNYDGAYYHSGVNQDIVYWPRPDVIRRKNESPTDMLNNDGSLKYPDGFYGYVTYSDSYKKSFGESSYTGLATGDNITDKVNQILLYEDYYLTNEMTNGNIHGGWEDFVKSKLNANYEGYSNASILEQRFLKSELASQKLNGTKSFIDLMFANNYESDAYQIAKEYSKRDLSSYSVVNYVENIPSKYNIYDSVPKEGVAYYYPTKIWKINNATIVVDVRIDDGELLSKHDVAEIQGKIMQSNTESWNFWNDKPVVSTGKYMVFARYFNEDMTQGLIPDFGVEMVNYGSSGNNGILADFDWILYASDYAYNDIAKDVVRRYYAILSEKYSNGESFSSKEILTQVSNETGVPYMDALNIWASYYISHSVHYSYYQHGAK